jgi:hypothetical protein
LNLIDVLGAIPHAGTSTENFDHLVAIASIG